MKLKKFLTILPELIQQHDLQSSWSVYHCLDHIKHPYLWLYRLHIILLFPDVQWIMQMQLAHLLLPACLSTMPVKQDAYRTTITRGASTTHAAHVVMGRHPFPCRPV